MNHALYIDYTERMQGTEKTTGKPRVCVIITNEIIRDGRVLREAKSLATKYEVLVLGLGRGLSEAEKADASVSLGLDLWWTQTGMTGWLPKWKRLGYAARFLDARRQIVARIRSFRPDIVHAHEAKGLPIGHRAARACGAKLIYDAHELYRDMTNAGSFSWHDWLYRKESRLMRGCAAIIACNQDRAEIMHKEYGAPFVPTVIENLPPYREAITSTYLRDYLATRSLVPKHIVLHQGAMMPGRGIETVIDAVPELIDGATIVFVGPSDPRYLETLKERVKALGVEDRCVLHPAVDHAKLFPITCSADVGVVTYQPVSRNNIYCAPNKLYEYSQAGLPIVGADLPPIRRYLSDTGTGELMDPGDATTIAQAINTLLEDAERYASARRNGLEAAKRYCWEAGEASLLALYDEVLTRAG